MNMSNVQEDVPEGSPASYLESLDEDGIESWLPISLGIDILLPELRRIEQVALEEGWSYSHPSHKDLWIEFKAYHKLSA